MKYKNDKRSVNIIITKSKDKITSIFKLNSIQQILMQNNINKNPTDI